MTNKKFGIFDIAIFALSFVTIILVVRNLIVRDYGSNGYGHLISNVIQSLVSLTFFVHGVKHHKLNRKLSYIYFAMSIGLGIVVMFIIFLP